jgi:diguanylate cyclase (GGDEF)-like protein/PAS domain S-box-containing protein
MMLLVMGGMLLAAFMHSQMRRSDASPIERKGGATAAERLRIALDSVISATALVTVVAQLWPAVYGIGSVTDDPVLWELVVAHVIAGTALSSLWFRSAGQSARLAASSGAPRRSQSLVPLTATMLVLAAMVWTIPDPPGASRTLTAGAAVVVVMAMLARQSLMARTEAQLLAVRATEGARQRMAALVEHGSDLVSIIDEASVIRYASPSHRLVMGIAPEQVVGIRVDDVMHVDDRAAFAQAIDRLRAGHSLQESLVARMPDASGGWRWLEAVATNLLHEPEINGFVLNSRDITDRTALEATLREQVLHDPLTGLGNRRLFVDRVQHAMDRRGRRAQSLAILFLDLDHFKFVNDTMGHATGDALLTAVADRLRALVRAADTVVRLGGDEFAVLLEDVEHTDEVDATATRIIDALHRPFDLDDRRVVIGTSIGIAFAETGQGVDALVADADRAMYSAKSAGRGRVVRFSRDMRTRMEESLALEADLRDAIRHDTLDVAYQPVVDLETGEIRALEALVRWEHPSLGTVAPSRLLAVAEGSDLISDLGRYMLRAAASDIVRFRETSGSSSMLVAVNLSARHLLSIDLLRDVADALADAGATGDALAIEVTEAMLAAHGGVARAQLDAVRQLGVRVALDDFGTGFSSLSYLRDFPIDMLKIDKSFVMQSDGQSANRGVTAAIVAIGRSLGMQTVAEGVETEAQRDAMRLMGCAMAQGYLYSPPLAAEALDSLLRTWSAVPMELPR